MTISQLVTKPRVKKVRKIKNSFLSGSPQRSGTCVKVATTTPKKPNSAVRKILKVRFSIINKYGSGVKVRKISSGSAAGSRGSIYKNVYVPGEGQDGMAEHIKVLIEGGRTQDLIGVLSKLVRGKYDVPGVKNRRTSRSLYGVKQPKQTQKR